VATFRSAIQRWHAGQLIIFWVAAILMGAALLGVGSTIPTSGSRLEYVPCPPTECTGRPLLNIYGEPIPRTKEIRVPEPHPVGDILVSILIGTTLVGIPIVVLSVTWVWFGDRQR
jgi:hypothetical protein